MTLCDGILETIRDAASVRPGQLHAGRVPLAAEPEHFHPGASVKDRIRQPLVDGIRRDLLPHYVRWNYVNDEIPVGARTVFRFTMEPARKEAIFVGP